MEPRRHPSPLDPAAAPEAVPGLSERLRRRAAGVHSQRRESTGTEIWYGGGAAAQPDADGGTACLAFLARTGAPRGAAPPHTVTIQALPRHAQVVTSKTKCLFLPNMTLNTVGSSRVYARGLRNQWVAGVCWDSSSLPVPGGRRRGSKPGPGLEPDRPKLNTGPGAGHLDSPASQGAPAPRPPGPTERGTSEEGRRRLKRRPGGEREEREGETRARVHLRRAAATGP